MLYIPTYLDRSSIHGTGLFTNVDIRKGTLIWCFDDRIDNRLRLDQVLSLPPSKLHEFTTHGYEDLLPLANHAHYIWCGDNGIYINHSPTPNTVVENGNCDVAAFDIPAGTELTSDYASFGADYTKPIDWAEESSRYAHLLARWRGDGHHQPTAAPLLVSLESVEERRALRRRV